MLLQMWIHVRRLCREREKFNRFVKQIIYNRNKFLQVSLFYQRQSTQRWHDFHVNDSFKVDSFLLVYCKYIILNTYAYNTYNTISKLVLPTVINTALTWFSKPFGLIFIMKCTIGNIHVNDSFKADIFLLLYCIPLSGYI